MKTFLLKGIEIRVHPDSTALSAYDLISAVASAWAVHQHQVRDKLLKYMRSQRLYLTGSPRRQAFTVRVELAPGLRVRVVKPEYLPDVITGMEPPVEWKAEFWEAYAEFLRSNYTPGNVAPPEQKQDAGASADTTPLDPDLVEAMMLIKAEQIRRNTQPTELIQKLAKVLTPTRHSPEKVRSRSGSLQDWKLQLRKLYVDREAIECRLRHTPMTKETTEVLKAQKHALDAQIWELSDAISNSEANED